MIHAQTNSEQVQIVLMPNRSMSWKANKTILVILFLFNMTIALAWTAMGAWMVLPFAGLEIFFVGIGMYYVSWKLNFKQILTIENESLVLQKGVYFPKQEWHWQRSATRLVQIPNNHRLSAPSLWLNHLNEQIEIGDFLNLDEKKQLRKLFSPCALSQLVLMTLLLLQKHIA